MPAGIECFGARPRAALAKVKLDQRSRSRKALGRLISLRIVYSLGLFCVLALGEVAA
jgi:hypothetical protein